MRADRELQLPFRVAVATLLAFTVPLGSLAWAEDANEKGAAFAVPPIEVPPGFEVELAAGPPLVQYPMMAALDEQGRLFIAESDGQNLGREDLLEQKPRFVRMLEDIDGDGKFDKSTIFADKMVMPEGALCHDGSFYILSAPFLWRLDDRDADGVADHRETLVGEMDLIGNANQHGPYLTPAGRLLFSGGTFGYHLVGKGGGPMIQGNWAGVFSCQTDGTDLRVECHAGINPVEVEFTPEGEMLGTCAIFDRVGGRCDALVHWVHGGIYAERLREPVLKQSGHYLPAALRWGQVAPSGLVRMRGEHFGDEYRGSYFACLFNTHELVRVRLERMGATFRGECEPFLRSPSTNFHPADVLEDADGSLLLVDTGAWLTMGCPSSAGGATGGFGAIYRVRKKEGKAIADPRGSRMKWQDQSSTTIARRLADPRPAVSDRALNQLVQRGAEAVPALIESARHAELPHARRAAVWALARIDNASARAALVDVLSDTDPSVRQAATHSVGVLREGAAVERLAGMVIRDQLPIRREAATALGLIGDPSAAAALIESLRTAEDEFLEHALIYALIEIEDVGAIQAGLASDASRVQRGVLLAWNQIDPDSLTRERVAPLLATSDRRLQQAAMQVISQRPAWAEEIVALLRESLAAEQPMENQRAIIAGATAAFADQPPVQSLVAEALQRPASSEVLVTVLDGVGRISQPQIPENWITPLSDLLSHDDLDVRRRLLASLATLDVGPLEPGLRRLASEPEERAAIRLSALCLLCRDSRSLDDSQLNFLSGYLERDGDPVEMLKAATALAAADLRPEQLRTLLPAVRRAGPLELPLLLQAFQSATERKLLDAATAREIGLQLVSALADSPGASALPPARIQKALSGYPAEVTARAAERFPSAAVGEAELRARLAPILEQMERADPEAGKLLFFSNRLACWGCHRVQNQGGTIGPDLTRIASVRTPSQLAESVVLPSVTIANGFESYSIVTVDGRVRTGIISRETADAIHLLAADTTEHRVRRSEIETIQPQLESLMPQGLDKLLTQEQLRDLVAFLNTLR